MKAVFLLIFFIMAGCQTAETVIISDENENIKENNQKSSYSYTSTSKGNFQDVVRDPIDYSDCEKSKAILYDGQYFCSKTSIETYKQRKK